MLLWQLLPLDATLARYMVVVSVCLCRPGKSPWIHSKGKRETRYPVYGYFCGKFPAICNHFGVMAAWSRKSWKKSVHFDVFLEKRPFAGKLSKVSRHKLTCYVQISRNLDDQKSVKSSVAYLTKTSPGCPAVATARIAFKNLPVSVPDSVLRVLHTSSKSVHFRRSYSRTREHRRNAL